MLNSTENSYDLKIKIWIELLENAMELRPNETNVDVILHVIFLCVILTVSVIGNSLTCIVIYYDKSMHTVTNYYLFNLAISDLTLTFAIIWEIFDFVAPPYDCFPLLCQITWFSNLCLWNSGIFTMTALSIERYFAICHPLKLKSSSDCHRVVKIIVILWLVAVADSVPEVLTVRVVKIHRRNVCFPIPTPLARVVHGIQATVTFAIPLIIMTFVYSTILFKVNTKWINLNDKIFNHRESQGKANKLIVAMTASFLVCWLPFFTVRVMLCALNENQLLGLFECWNVVYHVVGKTIWLSVVLNPIIFSLMSTKFIRALKTLWNIKVKNKSTNVI